MSIRPSEVICFIIALTFSPTTIFWFCVILIIALIDGPMGFLFDIAMFAGVMVTMFIIFCIALAIKTRIEKNKIKEYNMAQRDDIDRWEMYQ